MLAYVVPEVGLKGLPFRFISRFSNDSKIKFSELSQIRIEDK